MSIRYIDEQKKYTDLFTQQIKNIGLVKHLSGVKNLHIKLAVTNMDL